jgi:small basic protein (TIGR04137 family)
MSIHPSLKTKSGALNQHRNVLKRSERIAKLTLEAGYDAEKKGVLGLVKVRSIKAKAGKKAVKKDAAAAGDAKAAAPAAGAKAAAPAAGAAAKKK